MQSNNNNESPLLDFSIGEIKRDNLVKNPILTSNFKEYVILGRANGKLAQEFARLNPVDKILKACEISNLPENLAKCRYKSLPTYDHSRVVIQNGDDGDFINANWVDSYSRKKRYIATQCPTRETAKDFFQMIWENGVQQVINLASPRDMGPQGRGYDYLANCDGDVKFRLISQDISTDTIVRRYELEKELEIRSMTHFHFQSWPDLGTPDNPNSILNLISKIKGDGLYSMENPLLVHCMAGVGRSGTFILIDSMLEMAAEAKNLDFLAHLHKIRGQRISLVETGEQYVFAHEVLASTL